MEKLYRHGNRTGKFVKEERCWEAGGGGGGGGGGEGKSCNHCYKSADNLPLLKLLQTSLQ